MSDAPSETSDNYDYALPDTDDDLDQVSDEELAADESVAPSEDEGTEGADQ